MDSLKFRLNGITGYYEFDDNRYLVACANQKDSKIKLSEDEYKELKEMGMYTKKDIITNIIGDLCLEVNVYFPEESDSEFKKDQDGYYIVPLDNLGTVEIVPSDEDEEDE